MCELQLDFVHMRMHRHLNTAYLEVYSRWQFESTSSELGTACELFLGIKLFRGSVFIYALTFATTFSYDCTLSQSLCYSVCSLCLLTNTKYCSWLSH